MGLLFWLMHMAHAEQPAVTAALYPPALALVTDAISGQQIDIVHNNLSAQISCFSALGVRNLNLSIPIDAFSLQTTDGVLHVDVALGAIEGSNWYLYAEAQPNTLCSDFSGTLQWLSLLDGNLSMDVGVAASDGELSLSLLSSPVFSGDIDMDIEWAPGWAEGWGWDLFPDDLVLSLFEDDILDLLGEQAGEMLSTAFNENIEGLQWQTEIGQLDLGLQLDGLAVSTDAIAADVALDLEWTGWSPCEGVMESPSMSFDLSTVAMAAAGDEAVGFGVTEDALNSMMHTLWEDGLFCLTPGDTDVLLADMLPGLDGEVSSLSGMITLNAPPTVGFDSGAVTLSLPAANVHIIGRYRGERVTIVQADVGVETTLALQLSDALGSITASLESLVLAVDVVESNHLFADSEDATANFEDFVEEWVPTMVEGMVQDLPVLDVAGIAGAHAGRLTDFQVDGGVLRGGLSIYAADDPTVDIEPPETDLAVVDVTENSITVNMMGSDDRSDPLAYRYRINRGKWSAWTLETEHVIPVDMHHNNLIEVVCRDRWLNTDPTPVSQWVYPESVETPSFAQLGCAHGGMPLGGGALLSVLAMLWCRRQETPTTERGPVESVL